MVYFAKDKRSQDGLTYYCKSCRNKKVSTYNSANYKPEQKRRYALKRYFGITLEQYEEMFIKQNGVCALCGMKPQKPLSVDHCHTTNRVRGLLCQPCNMALGLLKDNIKTLQNAINYLSTK